MPGPMVEVDTEIAAVNLDVARQLYMGDDCRLRLIVPDQTQAGGYRVIAEYIEAFDEMDEAEREVADGSTIVFDIADIFDPPGELRTKLDEAGFIQLYVDGVTSDIMQMNDVPEVRSSEGQVYRITCGSTTFKQTFMRVAR